ncbi:MAG: hypothetical protein IV105_12405 [Rhizobacter sp.]|nr:hypothetical protein [Rhizobacter sp.]
MFQEILLIVIVVAGGIATSRLWPRHKLLAAVVCVVLALLVVWLARHWHIDLSGVS